MSDPHGQSSSRLILPTGLVGQSARPTRVLLIIVVPTSRKTGEKWAPWWTVRFYSASGLDFFVKLWEARHVIGGVAETGTLIMLGEVGDMALDFVVGDD